ncbi:MAG: L-2-hydroxyglutarate oxidase LhgO [Parasphingorhabdus sp.]
MPDIETIVVGAGAVGLAIAYELSRQGQQVMVLECHDRVGSETSARNSEVIHAGLYYPLGSLRAIFCVEGKQLLYTFCDENAVDVKHCGKLLVATSEAEKERLQKIKTNAISNGVNDLLFLTQAKAMALEPALNCVAACLSPGTGVVDSHGYMQALEGHIAANNGEIVLNTEVTHIQSNPGSFKVQFLSQGDTDFLTCRKLVNAAGHGATRLGDCINSNSGYQVPRTWPAKGHYFQYQGTSPFSHLIYPMPDGAWLGTHLTLDTQGKAKFGPDIEWVDSIDYKFDYQNGARKQRFADEIRRYFPDLNEDNLVADYTGIRPKIYRQDEPVADFAIHDESHHGVANLVSLYGIESPGLTSSLAIGKYVSQRLL